MIGTMTAAGIKKSAGSRPTRSGHRASGGLPISSALLDRHRSCQGRLIPLKIKVTISRSVSALTRHGLIHTLAYRMTATGNHYTTKLKILCREYGAKTMNVQ